MRERASAGLLAGSLGGLAALLLGMALGPLAGVPALPDLLTDRALDLTPGPLFGALIDRLQFAGRPLLFAAILVGELLVLTAFGPAIGRALDVASQWTLGPWGSGVAPRARSIAAAVLVGVALWLVFELAFLPLAKQGLFGFKSPFGAVTVALGYLLESLLYVATTGMTHRQLLARAELHVATERNVVDPMRRVLAGGIAATAALAVGGVALARYRAEQATVAVVANSPPTLAVTPNANFYIVAKSMQTINVRIEGWRLAVTGMVTRELSLTYDELVSRPSVDQYTTLTCISNDVGGPLMSNALWKGIPLATLLDQAGADSSATSILFKSLDAYTESLPIDLARRPTTLIAFRMNSSPLPAVHGFPARLLVPGHYGLKHAKWLSEITVAMADDPGFWEQHGWSEVALVRTAARIDVPRDGQTVALGDTALSGVAFAGERGIQSVQIGVTPGDGWFYADVEPPLGAATWRSWSLTWHPPAMGTYQIRVRAIDGSGATQEERAQPSFPAGAAGLHTIKLRVR